VANFWDWRPRSAESSTASTAVAELQSTLHPVELYTKTAMVSGLIAAEGRRLSDILNSNTTLPIRDACSTSLLSNVNGEQGSGWTSIDTDDILFAVPPEHESPRQLRIHRRQHRVRIRTGPVTLTGTAHVLPGVTLDAYALRRQMRFLALTDVQMYVDLSTPFERAAPVVLVNVRPVNDLTEVTTIS